MYDKEIVYDEKVSPLMTEIIKICKENDIKMFADFYLREPTETDNEFHCTTVLHVGENKSDRLSDLVKVAYNGYIAQKPYFAAMTVTKEAI
jgi:hypothetical protein